MLVPLLAMVAGLVLLAWSADRFVEGAAAVSGHFGLPPLLIGMVVVGFGTSAPEMVVSVLAAVQGNPGIALGNAYGSNITNIALILGLTALIRPILVRSQVLRQELPILTLTTGLAAWQLRDGTVSRLEALVLLGVFAVLISWAIVEGLRHKDDSFGSEMAQELEVRALPLGRAISRLTVGLLLLVVSSRLLVWGAVAIARSLGVSDLVIGLTIVAIGTSLPELASAIAATRKGEHDLALGNVLGSNLFNTLAVVGLAGAIHPMTVEPQVFTRDIPVMAVLTLSLFGFGVGFGSAPGRITRLEGGTLLVGYLGYAVYLVRSAF